MSRFKVGDRVVVAETPYESVPIGSGGVVVDVYESVDSCRVRVDDSTWTFNDAELELSETQRLHDAAPDLLKVAECFDALAWRHGEAVVSGAVKPWEFRPQGIMHNGVYVVWTGSDARMYALDATKRQIEALPLLVAALELIETAGERGFDAAYCRGVAKQALAALRGDDAAEGVQS